MSILTLSLHVAASPLGGAVPAAKANIEPSTSLTPNINPVNGMPAPVETPSAPPNPSVVLPEAGSGAQPAPSNNLLANVKTNNPNPIKKGYVAFGDSFAAGIGTGTTEWSGCRQGEFAYPKLIASTAQDNPDFQNLACSGAVIDDLLQGGDKSQVDSWVNPGNADIGTLTIGGNDVRFFQIMDACVIRLEGLWSGNCDDKINNAYSIMHSMSFLNDLKSLIHQILDKSGRSDFRLFFMGYPSFFNTDQQDCESVTFSVWNPHHAPSWGQPDYSNQWLYKEHRLKLNNLVAELNNMIRETVDAVNGDLGLPWPARVTFIDPNPTFNDHRFCEEGVTEPDSGRRDTWFFLNTWNDFPIGDQAAAADVADQTSQGQQLGNLTALLPNPNTCQQDLAKANNNDWNGKPSVFGSWRECLLIESSL